MPHARRKLLTVAEEFESDEFHHYFHIRCTCKGDKFGLVQGDKRSLLATCSLCASEWRIYDLELYPAATKEEGEESFDTVLVPIEDPRQLIIYYEYGENDPGQIFDPNDITWCRVLAVDGEDLEEIFDDETA